MKEMEMNLKGEFRRLSPIEVGELVLLNRSKFGWKQLRLANDSGVDERTIRRIEKGAKASDESLEQIAIAFGMESDSFTKSQFVPDIDDLMQQAREFIDRYQLVDALELRSWRDFRSIVFTHGFVVDDSQASDEVAEIAEELREALVDVSYIVGLSPEAVHDVELYKSLFEKISRIEGYGYLCRYAIVPTEDDFDVSNIVIFDKSDPSQMAKELFIHPRRLADMGAPRY